MERECWSELSQAICDVAARGSRESGHLACADVGCTPSS